MLSPIPCPRCTLAALILASKLSQVLAIRTTTSWNQCALGKLEAFHWRVWAPSPSPACKLLYLTFDIECNAARHPKFPPNISLVITLLCVLITNYVCWMFLLCCLHMPWGAKRERKATEAKLPEVSANLCCAISLTHNCIRKLESPLAIVPATTFAENFVNPASASYYRNLYIYLYYFYSI